MLLVGERDPSSKATCPVTWQANMALQHLTLAARRSLCSGSPAHGACPSPRSQRCVLGRRSPCSRRGRRVWMCRHAHRAHGHGMRQPPHQPTAGASRCEWVFDTSTPGPQNHSPPQSSGREGAGLGGVVCGGGQTEASPLSGGGTVGKPGNGCLKMGRGRRDLRLSVDKPASPILLELPCLPGCQAICLYRREDRGQGRASTLRGWVGKRSGPAERLLQLLAGRWVPGAGKLGTAEGGDVRRMRESSSTWKRNTKTQQTHECTQAHCEQGARAVQGKEAAALPSPTWSLPCGWRRPAGQAPTRACESTASHAVKSWVGSSGWKGEKA